MRYTTIIDITDIPSVYRNINTRLVYVHMALKAGYHDDDRDLLKMSIRRIMYGTGLTLSAVRHALKQLEKAGLVTREGDSFRVVKFVLEKKATTRRQSNTVSADSGVANKMRKAEEEKIARQRILDNWWRTASREEVTRVLESLKTSRIAIIDGVRIYYKDEYIEALENKLKKL